MKMMVQLITAEAKKLICRHERYAKDLHDEFIRRNRRSGGHDVKQVLRPAYWSVARGFNPYLVRSGAERIGHSVQRSLRRRMFRPRPAVVYEVPKGDGTNRSVSVFQIADQAVSRQVYKSLLHKNRSRLSAYSFAYRPDLTVHDAIQHIAADIRGSSRVFIAEYDFRKYFDSIQHEYIIRTLRDQRFLSTDVEDRILCAFLSAPALPLNVYNETSTDTRDRGVPQGTSVSLFLANVAAWPLDRTLERLGVGFARYADDTLIWSKDYTRICEAADALQAAAQMIGSDINLEKSEGISILAPEGAPTEFKTKSSVSFVGYSFSASGISIRPAALARIKSRIAYLVYKNLIEQPKKGIIIPARFGPPVDRDYVVLVYQLRRYLYGNLSEQKLRAYLQRSIPVMRYKGVMAFYPLVDTESMLRGLDGWILHTVHTALRTRMRLLHQAGHANLPPPLGLRKEQLPSFQAASTSGAPLDLRLPSVVRVGKLIRRASKAHGANAVAHPRSNQYYFVSGIR